MADNKFVKMSAKELREKYDKPIDRIKHMSNGQIAIRTLLMFLALTVASFAVYLVIYGYPILGIPGKNAISQVEISSPRLTEQVAVVTDEEYVEYSINIVSYLNKSLFKEYDVEVGEPIVTVKYVTKKGETVEIAANDYYCFYKGEVFPMQRPEMFVAIAEGIYFPELADLSRFIELQN